MGKEITLEVHGLGIIMYSDFAVTHIAEGEDYFISNYQEPELVAKHVCECTIAGFCTSTPGIFVLRFKNNHPSKTELNTYAFKLRLGLEVRDGRIWVRDLFDLMNWQRKCPEIQCIEVMNGLYDVILCANLPESCILGDNQEIIVYLNKSDCLPELDYAGVPILFE